MSTYQLLLQQILIELKILTEFYLKCLPFLIDVAITLSYTSNLSISFPLLWLLFPAGGPFARWFSSKMLSSHLPILLYQLFHSSCIHSCNIRYHVFMTLDFLSLIQTLFLNFRFAFLDSTRWIPNTLTLTYPKLKALYPQIKSFYPLSNSAPLNFIRSSIQVWNFRNFRISSSLFLTCPISHYVWWGLWISLESTPWPLLLSCFRLSSFLDISVAVASDQISLYAGYPTFPSSSICILHCCLWYLKHKTSKGTSQLSIF